jgi:CRP-like cAMP-binding protein
MPSGALKLEMLMIPERPTNVSVIEACTLFNGLEPEQKAQLAAESFMAYAERGEAIWTAGSPSDFVAVSGAGFVKMTRTSPTGQEVAMELLGPGQCFGFMAAIEGRSFPLSAVAVSNCWYLKIPTRVLMPIYQASGQLKDLVVRNIGPRLRKAHDMMTRLSSGRVEERIAAILLILADSYGERTPNGLELKVPLTRQDIGEMAGTTVETTIRVLSKWQKDGLITTQRQLITIQNEERVEDILRSV